MTEGTLISPPPISTASGKRAVLLYQNGCLPGPRLLFRASPSLGLTLRGLCALTAHPGEAASVWSPLLLMALPGAVDLFAWSVFLGI